MPGRRSSGAVRCGRHSNVLEREVQTERPEYTTQLRWRCEHRRERPELRRVRRGRAEAKATLRLRLAAVLALWAGTAQPDGAPYADRILVGGRIWTGEAGQPWAEALAVRGGT